MIREQAESDHLNPDDTDISPTHIVVLGKKCYMLALPSVMDLSSLGPEPMMPLGFVAPQSDSQRYFTHDRNNERFSPSMAVGVIADYDPGTRRFLNHPVFTQRAFQLATLHAQAIGAVIEGAKRHNPFYCSPRTEASSIVAAIIWALESADVLPAEGDRDARRWPILGISYLSVPTEGGSCEIGFLRTFIGNSRCVEQRHRVSVGLNDWGMLESEYEHDSTSTRRIS